LKRKTVSGIMLTLMLISISTIMLPIELATANPDLEPDSRQGVSIIRLTFNPDSWDIQPNIAGDGSKVAFMHHDGNDYEIFVVNTDGTGLTQLTDNNLMDRWASISRDGSKIAFVSYTDWYQGEIFVVNSDGSGLTQLTNNGRDNDEPSLSADGTKIAFRSGREIWVINSNGSGLIKVGDNTDASTGSGPAISGDGSKVAFESLVGGYGEIFVVNSDGTGLTQLTNKQFKSPNRISISDDGSKVTFEAYDVSSDSFDIFVVNTDGSGLRRLTNYGGIDGFWNDGKNCISANGSRIAFASNRYSVSDIFVVDSYGLRVDQITNTSFRDLDPSISDDGSKIAFASERYGKYDIFLAIYEPTTLPTEELHDVTVIGVQTPRGYGPEPDIFPNTPTVINVTIANIGLSNEFDVEIQFLVNDVLIDSKLIPQLTSMSDVKLSFPWTSPETEGVYNLTIYVVPVLGEDVTDNNHMYSLVTVRRTAVVFEIAGYYSGESAYAVWLGDLNDDGVVDLATTNGMPSLVTVMLGLGDCTFSSGLNYSVGRLPRGIVGADLDGDGDTDLATANQRSNSVSVLLNKGNGTFAVASEFLAGQEARDICAADFDGDGDVDLATANYASPETFSVLINDGDATFAEPVEYNTGGRWPTSIVARDLDGDGDIDIAVGNQFGWSVSVLLNHGDGTFGNRRSYGGANVWDVYAEDFDGDGDFDLAVANSWGGRGVSILLNRGDATFTWHGEYSVERNPRQVYGGDFDSDGDMDLAVTTDTYLSILVNSGDGTFAEDSRYDEGRSLQSVYGADLDSDEDIDLVTTSCATDTVTVLCNRLLQPTPPSPLEALEELTQTVESWNLDNGIETSLISKLQVAYRSLDLEKQNATIGQLTAFINEAEALRGKKLPDDKADQLISEAQSIIALIKA